MTALTVDGFDLQTVAWNIASRARGWQVVGLRGGNPQVPSRDGSIPVLDRARDDAHMPLSMWVNGCDSSGLIPLTTSGAQLVRQNVDVLTRVFGAKHRLLHLVQTMDDASQREAYAQIVQTIDFTSMANATRAEFAVELLLPYVYWQDVADVTFTSSPLTVDATVTMAAFDGMTAPATDWRWTLNGPATNPRLTIPDSGLWVQYNGVLTSTETWVVDSALFTSKKGTTNVVASTQHNGSTRVVAIPRAGGPQVVVGGSGFGAATVLTVVGRRKFHIA
jgi:hypothetical protein